MVRPPPSVSAWGREAFPPCANRVRFPARPVSVIRGRRALVPELGGWGRCPEGGGMPAGAVDRGLGYGRWTQSASPVRRCQPSVS